MLNLLSCLALFILPIRDFHMPWPLASQRSPCCSKRSHSKEIAFLCNLVHLPGFPGFQRHYAELVQFPQQWNPLPLAHPPLPETYPGVRSLCSSISQTQKIPFFSQRTKKDGPNPSNHAGLSIHGCVQCKSHMPGNTLCPIIIKSQTLGGENTLWSSKCELLRLVTIKGTLRHTSCQNWKWNISIAFSSFPPTHTITREKNLMERNTLFYSGLPIGLSTQILRFWKITSTIHMIK